MNWPLSVTIKEVGPRDGLQNEKSIMLTKDKVEWINKLSATGLSYIEITSFVHPKWIPALADCFEVATRISKQPHITYAALVPNEKGLEKAIAANVDEISLFLSSSETHNLKNINKSIAETLPILKNVTESAISSQKSVRAYISTVFGCPYEGKVDVSNTLKIIDYLLSIGVYEISLGDTIGVANPRMVEELLSEVLKQYSNNIFALHFHDTYGVALANVLVAMEMGITTFDGSIGGLGGCPYAPGASGNVATDDLNFLFSSMGIQTGINQKKLIESGKFLQQKLSKKLLSRNMLVETGR